MANHPISSLHLESSGISEEVIDHSQNNQIKASHHLLNLLPSIDTSSPSLSEKKLALLKQLLLLQKQSEMHEIGDPTLLLDENFELSPKNYSKLLQYMKLTAQKLNEAITHSSENLSKALGISSVNQGNAKITGISKLAHYSSIDSNSTIDSESNAINQHHADLKTFRNSSASKQKGGNEIQQSWNRDDDITLMKLAQKYQRDWNKISRIFGSVTQHNIVPEILKNRYSHLVAKKDRSSELRKNIKNFENFDKRAETRLFFNKPSNIDTRVEIEVDNSENIADEMIEYEELNPHNHEQEKKDQTNNFSMKDYERESVKVFFTKNEHLESKTLELPWINFDFERDFCQSDELFERITSCYNPKP